MKFTLKGSVYHVSDVKQITEKFSKREVVLEIEGQYPEYPSFTLANKFADLITPKDKGATVEIDFYIKGREYKDKSGNPAFFTTLSVFAVRKSNAVPPIYNPPRNNSEALVPLPTESDEDLPF